MSVQALQTKKAFEVKPRPVHRCMREATLEVYVPAIHYLMADEQIRLRVLTVGEGDCSFSLALARAFGDEC